MINSMFRKGLVFGIIVLFIGVGLSPVVTAVNSDTRDDEPKNISDVSEASDDYEEIITLIGGIGSITTVKRLGLFLREVNISPFIPFGGSISITGLRRSNGRVKIYHEIGNIGFVNVSRFRGFSLPREVGSYIIGIAFGDIEYNLSSFTYLNNWRTNWFNGYFYPLDYSVNRLISSQRIIGYIGK